MAVNLSCELGGGGGSAARMNIKYAVGHGTTRIYGMCYGNS